METFKIQETGGVLEVLKMCRICASFKKCPFSAVESKCGQMKLSDIIQECFPIKIDENDALPKGVCSVCFDFISRMSKLNLTILENERMFREKAELGKSLDQSITESMSPIHFNNDEESSTDASHLISEGKVGNVYLKNSLKVILKKFNCDEKPCEKKFCSENYLKIHKLIDHANILNTEDIGEAKFDVKVDDAENADMFDKLFGSFLLRQKNGKHVKIDHGNLYCKLCFIQTGKLKKFPRKSLKFRLMKHTKETHLLSEITENSVEVDATAKSDTGIIYVDQMIKFI